MVDVTRGAGKPSAWLVACVLALGSVARAQPRPWAAGVSDADQSRATEQFEDGNKLLEQGLFGDALALYTQAIARWDHPAIRYNIAVAQINLQRPIEAYRELERALRFGAEALEPDVYTQALAYQRLLSTQIVHLAIDCADAGTHVTLDGKDIGVPCPGSTVLLILPGGHRLVASKPGSLPLTIDLAPAGGESPRERIDLMTFDEATVTRRRWARWKPWSVVGAGVAVAAAGLGFELQAAATFRSYDRAVATLCPAAPCESLPTVVSEAYDEGRMQNRIAITLFAAGGAAIATGAALLWLNRSRTERIGYRERAPQVTATVGSRAASISARWSF
jgi:tetratricopeptide (TPR) repeat protein